MSERQGSELLHDLHHGLGQRCNGAFLRIEAERQATVEPVTGCGQRQIPRLLATYKPRSC